MLGGVTSIGFVGWFFFLVPHRVATAVSSSGGVQQVDNVVKGGYAPNMIEVEKDKPVQLNFYRDEDSSCCCPTFRSAASWRRSRQRP